MFGPSIAALSLLATTTLALPSITRTGKYLYDPSGSRFYIKGVAYQPQGELSASSAANAENGNFPEPSSYVDPLSSGANCTRDLPYLQQLGVNALRVYSVNPELNHDDCMRTFNENGIYVLLDVSLPLNGSIDRASPTWSTNLLDAYITTIDKFLAYENVLAFNVGNEVINLPSNTDAARKFRLPTSSSPSNASPRPSIRQGRRKRRQSLSPLPEQRRTRRLQFRRWRTGFPGPVGALLDVRERHGLPRHLRSQCVWSSSCGECVADRESVDNYEWCGASTYQASGWETIVNDFENLNVAAYMSEYGFVPPTPETCREADLRAVDASRTRRDYGKKSGPYIPSRRQTSLAAESLSAISRRAMGTEWSRSRERTDSSASPCSCPFGFPLTSPVESRQATTLPVSLPS